MDAPVHTHIRKLTTACAAVLVFSMASLHADNSSPPSSQHGPMGGSMGMDQQGHGNMQGPGMMDDLNLTDAQRTALRNAMQQRRTMMGTVRNLHEQLRAITESDKYDEKQVRNMVRKHNTEMENNIVNSTKAMHDFYASLTPEQKTKLEQHRKQAREHMMQRVHDRMHDRTDDRMGDDMGMDMMGSPDDDEGPDNTPPKH